MRLDGFCFIASSNIGVCRISCETLQLIDMLTQSTVLIIAVPPLRLRKTEDCPRPSCYCPNNLAFYCQPSLTSSSTILEPPLFICLYEDKNFARRNLSRFREN